MKFYKAQFTKEQRKAHKALKDAQKKRNKEKRDRAKIIKEAVEVKCVRCKRIFAARNKNVQICPFCRE
jgi:hypothetical protein